MLLFSVIKSWTSKRYTGTRNFKNVMIKCSPRIRKHIMKVNDDYVYMDYQGVKVSTTSLYHCAITAISSAIWLVNAQIRICQLPVLNVLDATKLRIVTVTLWRSV